MHQLCKNQLRGTLTRGIGGIDIIVYVVKTWQSYNVHYCRVKFGKLNVQLTEYSVY